jgi:hypothetical protein
VKSNQYPEVSSSMLSRADEGDRWDESLTWFHYVQTHFIYTNHNQFVTASAGAIYSAADLPPQQKRLAITGCRGAQSSRAPT